MLGSRGAFRTARNAAKHLGARAGLQNSSVHGGHFMQNCFISSVSASTTTLASGFGSYSTTAPADMLEMVEMDPSEVGDFLSLCGSPMVISRAIMVGSTLVSPMNYVKCQQHV